MVIAVVEQVYVEKIMKKVIAISLAVMVALVAMMGLAGCGNMSYYYDSAYGDMEAIAISGIKDLSGHDVSSTAFKGIKDSGIVIDLGQVKEFDTVVLKEKYSKTPAILKFSLETSTDNLKYELAYRNDTIEELRTAYLGNTSARYLRFKVLETKGNYFMESINIFKTEKKEQDLRVCAYLVSNTIHEDMNKAAFDAVTDIILFDSVRIDSEGNLAFADNIYGTPIADPLAHFEKTLGIVKDIIGGRDINLFVDMKLPLGDENVTMNKILTDKKDNVINNTITFLDKYDFDGVGFDYEYPYSGKDWKNYNNFIVEIDQKLGDRMLTVAGSGWNLNYTKAAIEAIDYVQVMSYDLMDSNGYHSTFMQGFRDVRLFEKHGFAKEKLFMGMPFYSRPIDGYPYWGGYDGVADELGKFDNLHYGDLIDDGTVITLPRYYNGYQMVRDKTAAAIDLGVSGLMIWHYACDTAYDHELSLFKAIRDVKTAKLR